MRMAFVGLLLAAASLTLVAQEDPFPVATPSRPIERKTQPRPAPKPAEETPAPPQERSEAADAPAVAPTLDKHFFQKDEYLVVPEGYKAGSSWAHAFIAKMVTPPTEATKQEGEFFIINGHKKGEKIWTKHYTLTRPAAREDLKLGAVVYGLDGNNEDDVYQGPKNREDNLNHAWFVGTINDDSNLYKGYLSLSGYKMKPSGLRIAIKK